MTISIVMPVLDSAKYVERAITSALSQMSQDDELIVQDGGSTDGTLNIVNRLGDRRVLLVSEPDDGQADALNRALTRVSGDWVGWLNADDFYMAEAFDHFRRAVASQAGTTLVTGIGYVVDAGEKKLTETSVHPLTSSSLLRYGCFVFSGATFIRRDFLQSVGPFDVKLRYCMDFDLFVRAFASSSFVPTFINEPIGALRIHQGSKTGAEGWRFVHETELVRLKYFPHAGLKIRGLTAIHRLTLITERYRRTRIYSAIRGKSRRRDRGVQAGR